MASSGGRSVNEAGSCSRDWGKGGKSNSAIMTSILSGREWIPVCSLMKGL
jgi:hypothetical protein